MPGSELVQSVVRALDILQLAGSVENGIRVIDAAEALEVKLPTAHNLIKTLASRGFLRKNESGTYVLGASVMDLTESAAKKARFMEIGKTMARIVKEIPEAVVIFADASYGRIYSRLRMSPDIPQKLQIPNAPMSAYSTASGIVHMAFGSKELKHEIMSESPFHENGIVLWKSIALLDKFMADGVKQGYISPDFEGALRKSFAAPVFSLDETLLGTLGITVDISWLTDSRKTALVELLKNSANSLKLK